MKASNNPYPSLLLAEQGSNPATPDTGFARLFVDDDGAVKKILDDGSVSELGGGGGGGGYEYAIDEPPGSADALDDEFDAALDTSTKWSWLNQGTSTADTADGRLAIKAQQGDIFRGLTQPAPSGAWTIECKVRGAVLNSNGVTYGVDGLLVSMGAGSAHRVAGIAGGKWRVFQGSGAGVPSSALNYYFAGTYTWVRAVWDETDVTFYASLEGQRWTAMHVWTPGSAPTLVGVAGYMYSQSGVDPAYHHVWDWFRRTA